MENFVTWIIFLAVTAFLVYGVCQKYSLRPSKLALVVGAVAIGSLVGWYVLSRKTSEPTPLSLPQVKAEWQSVSIKPGEPLVLRVEPGQKLEYTGGFKPTVEERGKDKIVTFSSDKEVTLEYHLYKP